jgi:hypothetical protein
MSADVMQALYSYAPLYEAYDRVQAERARALNTGVQAMNPLERFMHSRASGRSRDGFARIQACREALDALDRRGWQRSFHQRMFHENFIRACTRVFFKTEPQGAFPRAHQAILDLNGWDNLSQEILISTPRRCALFFMILLCTKPHQPGPIHFPLLSHASTPVEGLHTPLAITWRLPRMSL